MRLRETAIATIHPEKYRDPVRLFLEGHQPKDIAEMINVNRSTTRNLIQRGLVKFEEVMEKLDPQRNI